jgi:hypothetical protein
MVFHRSARHGATGSRLLCWPVAAVLTFPVGAALTAELPARRSLVGAFAPGDTCSPEGLVLMVVGIGIQLWRRLLRPGTPRGSLFRVVDDAVRSGLVLLGLAVSAAGTGLHPAALLVAGRPAGRNTRVLLGDLGAVLDVRAPLVVLVLGRRRATRSARPAP